MNWGFLLSFVLAFCLVFVIFMTLGFYINYKRAKRAQKQSKKDNPRAGRYFSRFIPDHLESVYSDVSEVKKIKEEKRKYSIVTKAIVAIPLTLFVAITGYFLIRHQEYLYAPIQLTLKEVSELSLRKYDWVNEAEEQRPHLKEVAAELRQKTLVFLMDERDPNWVPASMSRSLSSVAYGAWSAWADEQGVRWKKCLWKNMKTCLKPRKESIAVVLPGKWNVDKLNWLAKNNTRVLIVGPPAQIYRANNDHFNWQGLDFQRSTDLGPSHILLRGDQKLTLGWDAGSFLKLPRIINDFTLSHKNPDALRVGSRRNLGGSFNAALVSFKVNDTRVVWADFMPPSISGATASQTVSNSLATSIFRYLMDQEYSAVSTWPHGKSFAAFASLAAEENYEGLRGSVKKFKELKVPLATFAISDLAEKYRGLTKRLSKVSELHCLGDEHAPFDRNNLSEQTKRLALCMKSLEEISGTPVLGFSPPEEKHNTDTLNAAKNLGVDFLFTGQTDQLTPQVLFDKTTNSRLIRLGRATNNDLHYLVENKMSEHDIHKLVQDEIRWIKMANGIYSYGIHSQTVNQAINQRLIADINKWLAEKYKEIYLAGPKSISSWWRFRANLTAGMNPSQNELEHYSPLVIRVSKEGVLEKSEWGKARGLSSSKAND